ncbi:hypothetical protein P7D22_19180 [Lichenihabitans sp. Uapishka_5]|uniref:hypothetical protein n=1 Tax=Lichenihabitans sp. Uapishka_5 TaxID=3037302 RepID=UPI0029E80662|nr:hypothetical protein [Lichenihabitans sp. Uapishka_5]MDX7953290.1 hypothetical protein [Lichenihabitans sp. Uapishka_5]
MLPFIDKRDGARVWINPRQVCAVVSLKNDAGSSLMMSGGFEIQIEENAEEVSAQINKRLNAY